VGEKTQERTYKEAPRLHPGDPPHSTHTHTHVGADASYLQLMMEYTDQEYSLYFFHETETIYFVTVSSNFDREFEVVYRKSVSEMV
jgi:hypothetical protein